MAGRPKTYPTQADRKAAAMKTASLIQEIMDLSNMKSEAIADALKDHITLSGDLIRQYKRGIKPASPERLAQIALGAAELGWIGPNIKATLTMADWKSADKLEYTRWRRKLMRAMNDAEAASLRRLKSSLTCLAEMSWSDASIITAVIMLTKNLIPEENRTDGGLVALAAILDKLGLDTQDVPHQTWVRWDILNSKQAAKYLVAEERMNPT